MLHNADSRCPQFNYVDNCLSTTIEGSYHAEPPLANITIAGVDTRPSSISLKIGGQPCEVGTVVLDYAEDVVYLSGFDEFTPNGAWEGELEMTLTY